MALVPLDAALTPDDLALLRRLGEAAANEGVELWLVGGPVRDALLGRPVLDLDLTSEAPAAELGPRLAERVGGTCGARSVFGTVKLRLGGRTLDLATARAEVYPYPASLPVIVAQANMADDLARRDFGINAMAASLHPRRFGELLDTQGGVADLEDGVVHVLHRASFRDDPTRLFRAARYVSRLGFRMDGATRRQFRSNLRYMDAVSAARVRREIERLLTEQDASRAVLTAVRLGVLPAVESGLAAPEVRAALKRADARGLRGLALLGALTWPLPAERADAFRERIGVTKRQAQVMRAVVRLRESEQRLSEAQRPSRVSRVVGVAPREAVEAASAAAASTAARRNLARYLDVSRRRSPLDGHDLLALGVPPGPAVGGMLTTLRNAVLDGVVRARTQAERFVQERLAAQK
ncbi:MAG: CCA tRNA nucleotidyltransferase [Chloroflexi bacterium]|nr:CCA tRNA nucleotidyltransferase [Chloroflexota bacterium]